MYIFVDGFLEQLEEGETAGARDARDAPEAGEKAVLPYSASLV